MSKEQKLAIPEAKDVTAPSETLPDFLKDYIGPLGRQNIDPVDITIPRLKIGQAISD
jgi:hypothetical protein